jgi:5'-nucleotidase
MWQGTLESNIAEGAPMVAAYNALRYDAVAIGNHEFDFGPAGPAAMPQSNTDDPRGALKARAAEADFPFLAANLIDDSTGKAIDWPNVRSSTVVEIAGIRTGIIGLTSASTLSTTLSANVTGLSIANLAETIRKEAKALRASGAELVIVTSHAGGECTEFGDARDLQSCDPESEIFRVARALPEGFVDLIIGGHIHKGMAHEVNGIAVVSAWSGGLAFGRVDFELVGGGVVARTIHSPTRICGFVNPQSGDCAAEAESGLAHVATYEGRVVEPDAMVAAAIAPAIAAAAGIKDEKLGPFLETPFNRRPDPESALGNLFTDILLASEPDADIAIHNTLGGIRDDLPSGEITYGDVYEMFPFDNRIVHLSISGEDLRAIVANQLEGSRRRANISGARIFARCEGDLLDIRIVDDEGQEIHDIDRLLLVTNDFLLTGGDDVLTPALPEKGFEAVYEGQQVREVIVQWLRDNPGRLNTARFVDDSNPRWNFPRPAPIDCS